MCRVTNSPEIPKIRKRLAIFDPTIFPKAIGLSFLRHARWETKNSGNEVPNPTIKRPITSEDETKMFTNFLGPNLR